MIDLRLGDCTEVLRTLPAGSVHTCVTSPPYFGLRDYGADGQIGLERTPEEYVARMVGVFREVRRVLRDDGTLWLNLGDSYSAGGGGFGTQNAKHLDYQVNTRRASAPGLAHKQLIGIPWRVAFALQADGWYLRSDIIWHKPNPMPESVRDRPTKAHEYLFLLSKSERYHYDADAVKEDGVGRTWHSRGKNPKQHRRQFQSLAVGQEFPTRNRRSVWTVATSPYKGAHFATFPPKLIEPCILAGTSEAGCCRECGKPWERVVERAGVPRDRSVEGSNDLPGREGNGHSGINGLSGAKLAAWKAANPDRDLGFRPACSCDAGDPVPCTVLDPFNGAGTTGLVADQNGRSYIGIDLNPEYLALSRDRIPGARPAAVPAA